MKLDKQKLNKLVTEYRQNNCDITFSEIYKEVSKRWQYNLEKTAKELQIDPLDLQACYDDVVLKAVNDPAIRPETFRDFIGKMLANSKVDLYRKTRTIRKYYKLVKESKDEDGESDAATFDKINLIHNDTQTDCYTEAHAKEKEADQIRLIDSLIDPAKVADRMTTAIVNTVLTDRTLGKFKPTAIGEKLGVHHSKVTRKLHSLKKNYDESLFGDYREYLHA